MRRARLPSTGLLITNPCCESATTKGLDTSSRALIGRLTPPLEPRACPVNLSAQNTGTCTPGTPACAPFTPAFTPLTPLTPFTPLTPAFAPALSAVNAGTKAGREADVKAGAAGTEAQCAAVCGSFRDVATGGAAALPKVDAAAPKGGTAELPKGAAELPNDGAAELPNDGAAELPKIGAVELLKVGAAPNAVPAELPNISFAAAAAGPDAAGPDVVNSGGAVPNGSVAEAAAAAVESAAGGHIHETNALKPPAVAAVPAGPTCAPT